METDENNQNAAPDQEESIEDVVVSLDAYTLIMDKEKTHAQYDKDNKYLLIRHRESGRYGYVDFKTGLVIGGLHEYVSNFEVINGESFVYAKEKKDRDRGLFPLEVGVDVEPAFGGLHDKLGTTRNVSEKKFPQYMLDRNVYIAAKDGETWSLYHRDSKPGVMEFCQFDEFLEVVKGLYAKVRVGEVKSIHDKYGNKIIVCDHKENETSPIAK